MTPASAALQQSQLAVRRVNRRPRPIRMLGSVVASLLMAGLAVTAPADAAAGERSSGGSCRCWPAVTALPDLGFGGDAVDLSRWGVYAGIVYTAAENVDVTGDGKADPNRRAGIWVHKHLVLVPSGFAWDQVQDITDNLWVLGFGYDPKAATERSYVWRPGWKSVRVLQDPPGADSTRARRINERGEVVGGAAGPEVAPTPVYWRNYRSPAKLLPLGNGGLSGRAIGINNRGQIVGYVSDRDPDYGPDWFDFDTALWARPTVSAPARLPDLAFDSEAVNINDRGTIMGYVMTATPGRPPTNIDTHPALWRNRDLTVLTTPTGTHDARMFGLSRRGWVTGSAFRGSEPVPPFNIPTSQALLSTDQRLLRVLPDLTGTADPRRWNALASGVNDRRNEVSGWAFDGSFARAVVWSCASRQAVDLTHQGDGAGSLGQPNGRRP
jgi:uncharacterized membrane protein